MVEDLYFIPILARAFEPPDCEAALQRAFLTIALYAHLPGNERGHAQFGRFMREVYRIWERAQRLNELEEQGSVTRAALGTDAPEEEGNNIYPTMIRTPDCRRAYERLCDELTLSDAARCRSDVHLTRDGEQIGSAPFTAAARTASIPNITPGDYQLTLSTGRILWEDTLAVTDCIWTDAFPGEPVALAAATDGVPRRPSRVTSLLDGELILRVYPGIEFGRVELEWRRPQTTRRER